VWAQGFVSCSHEDAENYVSYYPLFTDLFEVELDYLTVTGWFSVRIFQQRVLQGHYICGSDTAFLLVCQCGGKWEGVLAHLPWPQPSCLSGERVEGGHLPSSHFSATPVAGSTFLRNLNVHFEGISLNFFFPSSLFLSFRSCGYSLQKPHVWPSSANHQCPS
jgi:hypothetical protein